MLPPLLRFAGIAAAVFLPAVAAIPVTSITRADEHALPRCSLARELVHELERMAEGGMTEAHKSGMGASRRAECMESHGLGYLLEVPWWVLVAVTLAIACIAVLPCVALCCAKKCPASPKAKLLATATTLSLVVFGALCATSVAGFAGQTTDQAFLGARVPLRVAEAGAAQIKFCTKAASDLMPSAATDSMLKGVTDMTKSADDYLDLEKKRAAEVLKSWDDNDRNFSIVIAVIIGIPGIIGLCSLTCGTHACSCGQRRWDPPLHCWSMLYLILAAVLCIITGVGFTLSDTLHDLCYVDRHPHSTGKESPFVMMAELAEKPCREQATGAMENLYNIPDTMRDVVCEKIWGGSGTGDGALCQKQVMGHNVFTCTQAVACQPSVGAAPSLDTLFSYFNDPTAISVPSNPSVPGSESLSLRDCSTKCMDTGLRDTTRQLLDIADGAKDALKCVDDWMANVALKNRANISLIHCQINGAGSHSGASMADRATACCKDVIGSTILEPQQPTCRLLGRTAYAFAKAMACFSLGAVAAAWTCCILYSSQKWDEERDGPDAAEAEAPDTAPDKLNPTAPVSYETFGAPYAG